MENRITSVSTRILGFKVLDCHFFKITDPGITLRLNEPGNMMVSELPTIEYVKLPFGYEDRFWEFFDELKNKIMINIMNDPYKSCSLNAWLALKDMNIKPRRRVENFTFDDLGEIIIEIFFESKPLAYALLSSVINYTGSNFTSTPDELMDFLQAEDI